MQNILKGMSVVFLWWMATLVHAVSVPNQEAYDLVQKTTDRLLERIIENREVYRQDTDYFFAEIDDLLSPVIDFQRISRRVMAMYYKKATPEQHEAFSKVFKQSLLKIYAKGMLDYDNEKVVILPPLNTTHSSTKRQRIDIELYSDNGTKYPITYSMFLDANKQWKMENVIVNGINIGLTYRNQFSRLMKLNNNDIDRVIADWTSDVNSDN